MNLIQSNHCGCDMYKYKKCLIALVCWLVAGSAEDCAGNSTLARAAEGFRTRLAAATAGCQVVVYTTLFYGAGVRFPHPRGRLGPEAYNGTAGECYLIVAGAASAASLREHCDVSPWRVVEMGASVHGGRRASRTLKLLPHRYFTARYVVFLDWKLSLRQHPLDLVDRTLRSGDFLCGNPVSSVTAGDLCQPPRHRADAVRGTRSRRRCEAPKV